MPARTGILMAGSLYWSDLTHRVQWRRDHLKGASEVAVSIPIRYGRRSATGSYTMVFDPACPPGQGKILECIQATTTLADLVREAQALWLAESPDGSPRKKTETLSSNWGCVALLVNPASSVPAGLIDGWAARVRQEKFTKTGERCYDSRTFAVKGNAALNDSGQLQIAWPVHADTQTPVNSFDLLLATATRPTPGPKSNDYPPPEAIAEAWRHTGKFQYFDENRKHGFHTFQDDEIIRNLAWRRHD